MRDSLSFCHQIFTETRAMASSFQGFMTPLFSEVGLKPLEGCVLAELSEQDGMSVNELSDATSIRTTNLAPLMHLLEEQDLVRRQKDEHDKRSWRFFLTPAGNERLDALDGLVSEHLEGIDDDARSLRTRILDGYAAFATLMEELGVPLVCDAPKGAE